MDLEKVISDSLKDKDAKLKVKLPSFEKLWDEAQKQNRNISENKKKRTFDIGGWLGIAAVLLIMTVLPFTITRLRNSSSQITPASKQAAATQVDIEEARKVTISFFTDMYTVDNYNSFTKQDEFIYPNDSRTQSFIAYTTDKYFNENFVPSREPLLPVMAAQKNKCTFEIDKITMTKYTEDAKNKNLVFNTEVSLKGKFKDGSAKTAVFRGQIIMVRENDNWKVGYYTVTSLEPKEMFSNAFQVDVDTTSVSKILKEFLPHPYNAEILPDTLTFKGKWKGSVMPEFTSQMEKMGWKLYDGMGAKLFYKKEIEGKEVKISILPVESGGPKEADAATHIFVKIED